MALDCYYAEIRKKRKAAFDSTALINVISITPWDALTFFTDFYFVND